MNKSLVQKDFNNAFSVRMKIRQIRALILCPKQLFNLELKAISNILLRLLLFLLLLVPARANAGVPVKSNIRSFMVVGNNRLHVNWLFHEPTAQGRSGMGATQCHGAVGRIRRCGKRLCRYSHSLHSFPPLYHQTLNKYNLEMKLYCESQESTRIPCKNPLVTV